MCKRTRSHLYLIRATIDTEGKGFVSDMSTTIPMRQITFQVSWTFGKQGNYSAKRASRTIQNESQLNSTTTAE